MSPGIGEWAGNYCEFKLSITRLKKCIWMLISLHCLGIMSVVVYCVVEHCGLN